MNTNRPVKTNEKCPSPNVLLKFTTGRLAPEVAEAISNHISQCNACLSALAEIDQAADPLTDELKGIQEKIPPDFLEDEPAFSKSALSESTLETADKNDRINKPQVPASEARFFEYKVNCPFCDCQFDGESSTSTQVLKCPECGNSFTYFSRGADSSHSTRIGHFELIESLGEGAFGTVWKASDIKLGRTVALKIPRGCYRNQKEIFIREARAAAQLMHPNIVRVFEVNHESDTVYIASEYIEGMTLRDYIQHHTLSSRDAAIIILLLAQALVSAHAAGIVHCDLKPANVLIDRKGKPHISDFGIARNIQVDITVTSEGRLFGTPVYMPPEQAQGDISKADVRSDIYSLGVILYEMLTGVPPFRGDLQMLIKQILFDEPNRPKLLNSRIPLDLETICLKCLEKKPESRYTTATELASDLEKYLDGRPILARRQSLASRVIRWTRHNRLASLMILCTLLCVLAVAGIAFKSYNDIAQAYHASLQAEERANSEREKAENSLHIANKHIYGYQISEANAHWQRNAPKDMLESLEQCPKEFRNFEWGYLKGLHHSAIHEFPQSGGVLEFSPDGHHLITGGGGYLHLKIWDVQSGGIMNSFISHGSHLTHIDYSSDGKYIASCGGNDHTVRIWKPNKEFDNYLLTSFEGKVMKGLITPDAKNVIAYDSENVLRICNIESLECRQILSQIEESIIDFDLHPSLPYIAIIRRNKKQRKVSVWNYDTEELVNDLLSEDLALCNIAYSPNGEFLAISQYMGMLRVWRTDPFELLTIIPGPLERNPRIAFNPESNQIAAQDYDGIIRIWAFPPGKEINRFRGLSGKAYELQFSPDGQYLAAGSDEDVVRIWNTTIKQGTMQLNPESAIVYDIEFSPCGRYMAASHMNGSVVLWSTKDYSNNWKLPANETAASDLSFSPDGDRILVSYYDSSTSVHDSTSGELLTKNTDIGNRVFTVDFNPHAKMVATSGGGGKIVIWNPESGETIKHFEMDCGELRTLKFSPDGSKLACGCMDSQLAIWDIGMGQILWHNTHKNTQIWDVKWSPDGSSLVVSYVNGKITFFDPETGAPKESIEQDNNYLDHTEVTFSPDGNRMYSVTERVSARIWDTSTKHLILEIDNDPTIMKAIAVSPDGRTLATGYRDGRIILWQAAAY